ncbi:50S ribosomal protein L25 [Striga asiatica]|uniref:50S ribosomal protein L25 n=1 Tax=Striga asiatica TaxID=4170 RepID=A0A5A7PJT3_STRAF|nr:50S ribosomal protein L25 [Striga asiatica]
MLIRRAASLTSAAVNLHIRRFSTASLFQEADNPLQFTYLDGLPRPNPKHDETILAIAREVSGKSIATKERIAGRVPSIVFEAKDGQHGGNKRLISVHGNQIKKLVDHLGQSFFRSRTFDLEIRPEFGSNDIVEKVRVLSRKFSSVLVFVWSRWHDMATGFGKNGGSCGLESVNVIERHVNRLIKINLKLHLHAGTDAVLNVTFIRAPSDAWLKVDVPLVYRGDDVSPGLKKGSSLNIIKRTIKYLCPADIIPPYIDVDLSELDVGEKIVAGNLNVHPALKLLRPKDEVVVKIMGARISDQKKSK